MQLDQKFLILIMSLVMFFLASYMLVTGSDYLMVGIDPYDRLPLGTPITWFGLVSLPLAVYYGSRLIRQTQTRLYRVFRWMIFTAIVGAVLWLPIAYLLSGNLTFTFGNASGFQGSNMAMLIFWNYSFAIPVLAMGVLLGHVIYTSISRIRHR